MVQEERELHRTQTLTKPPIHFPTMVLDVKGEMQHNSAIYSSFYKTNVGHVVDSDANVTKLLAFVCTTRNTFQFTSITS